MDFDFAQSKDFGLKEFWGLCPAPRKRNKSKIQNLKSKIPNQESKVRSLTLDP
ncbi:hypothetical protein GXM_03238 [Nostoc sphaeroides CCNUC1]|uniref:Uncharacterized protein n=1 Tax=Nostoc sphaeroides CCNUC1 TaxID=2653204 RepID=A0A5P8VZK4_9NOSO|nr:hypothetical protein GXM_03238 [Nostoc sphaeroides CCNUC1]